MKLKMVLTLSVLAIVALFSFGYRQYLPPIYTLTVRTTVSLDSTISFTHAFTTTAFRDTVLIKGALSTDWYLTTAKNDTSQTPISWIAKTDTVIFLRKAAGTSALTYSWLRIRNG